MDTLLWIPPTLGAISLLRISYGATSEYYRRSKDSDVYHFLDITSTKADGRTLFLLKLSTLLDTLVLFSLQIYSSKVQEVSLVEIFLLVFYVSKIRPLLLISLLTFKFTLDLYIYLICIRSHLQTDLER